MSHHASAAGACKDRAAGYASVDAMVALVILAMTIVMAMSAVIVARKAAQAAVETRQAASMLRYLLDSTPPQRQQTAGHANGFAWAVAVTPGLASAVPASILCRRTAIVTSERSRRRYALATTVLCPPPPS